MKDHRLIDERSLALHGLVAEKLRADSSLLQLARSNLDRWKETASPRARPVLDEWSALVDGPLENVLAVLTSAEERATRLRQSSPFAGALTPSERFAVLREFQARESRAA